MTQLRLRRCVECDALAQRTTPFAGCTNTRTRRNMKQVAKEVSDAIKESVKQLGYDRYKFIVQVRKERGGAPAGQQGLQ